MREGDYVLATKYPDGDPGDHFAIGYYKGPLAAGGCAHNRHIVVDESGRPFRAAGFRRAQRITEERGKWLLQRLPVIEQSNRSLWGRLRQPMRPRSDALAPIQ